MIAALLPLIGTLAPGLITWIMGDKAGGIAKDVLDTAQELFGTNDPRDIEKAIDKDPNLALQFKIKLLDIQDRQSQRVHEEVLAELTDIQNARGLYGQSHRVVDIMTLITVVMFFVVNGIALYGCFKLFTMPKGALEVTEFTIAVAGLVGSIIGYVNAKADVVWNFFFGSSRGSMEKTAAMGASMSAAIKAGVGR